MSDEKLLGKLEEFARNTEKNHDEFKEETRENFKRVFSGMENLNTFKWKVIGAAGCVIFLVQLFVVILDRVTHS